MEIGEDIELNKFTKSGLIGLVVALKKVRNHQEEEIKRLKRKIYNPFKRKYSDKLTGDIKNESKSI